MVEDVVSNFMYYDRKDDDDLSVNDIERAFKDGIITSEEVSEKFKETIDLNTKKWEG